MWHQLHEPDDPGAVALVVDLAQRAKPRCGGTVVVAIDGPSGSGKTTLAKGVVDALGCPVAHMDQIFPGWDGLAEAVPLLTRQVLEPLARGEQAAYRVWDWEQGTWGETIALPPHRFLVIEGCASTVLPAGAYAAARVWVEADHTVRMARGIERDGEVFRPNWERWAAQEDALFAADGTRSRADVVIDTSAVG